VVRCELKRPEPYTPLVDSSGHALRGIERDVAVREHRRRGRLRPSAECAYACDQLGKGERLRQVVVGADSETVDG
jgi:hypothetical protein